jgi:hypothetical protein
MDGMGREQDSEPGGQMTPAPFDRTWRAGIKGKPF